MNAFVSKEELAFLPTDRINHPHHYADATSQRRDAGLLGRFKAWMERRAVIAELSGLSERELADIGLTRSAIGHVFDNGAAYR